LQRRETAQESTVAKHFAIRTDPHLVTVGDTKLWFVPEANGAAFLQAYAKLRTNQMVGSAGKDIKPEDINVDDAVSLLDGLEEFITGFLVPDSVAVFHGMNIPQRVLVGIVEHLAELYGGGDEERPTTPSKGSAGRSRNPGARG
jgi:hypothetical protein